MFKIIRHDTGNNTPNDPRQLKLGRTNRAFPVRRDGVGPKSLCQFIEKHIASVKTSFPYSELKRWKISVSVGRNKTDYIKTRI